MSLKSELGNVFSDQNFHFEYSTLCGKVTLLGQTLLQVASFENKNLNLYQKFSNKNSKFQNFSLTKHLMKLKF